MFEDVCLLCGKALFDDATAYCSDECQNSDLVSPSISSSSSALSSPSLGYAHGLEVPPLAPAVLGSALRNIQKRDPYYMSSSASSNSWGVATEDEDDEAWGSSKPESIFEGSAKSANYIYSIPSGLQYARRPSIVNHHSTIPQVHQRSGSGEHPVSIPGHRQRGHPRSVPNSSSSATDDEDFSDSSSPSKRRNGDRGSLPSYFNLLRIKSPSKTSLKASPVLSSSTNTVAHLSPPTPKITVSTQAQVPEPPRGRRRNAEVSRCSRRSDNSSPSRSRSRHVNLVQPPSLDEFDSSPPRGRGSRRNSSPQRPARILIGGDAAALRDDRSRSSNRPGRSRGRVPVEELDAYLPLELAPGYGNGRSGLMDRERMANARIPL